MAGPYGQAEQITIYIQQSNGTEKEFTDIEGGYDIDITLNKIGIFNINMEGLEEADKAYIKVNNTVLIFTNMRLVMVGRLNSVSYGTESAVTISGEQLAVSKLMDNSTASLKFQNVDSCDINACLVCTGGSNIVSLGTNTNFGKISYRNEFDNVANGLNKVAGAVSFDWWTANGNSTCQCVPVSTACSGVYNQSGVKLIDDGESIYNWAAGAGACAVALNMGNKREGYASFAMGGEGACTNFCYTKTITGADTIIPFECFQWWLYVRDKTKLHATNPVRVCLYLAATDEGYFVDLTCASLNNGWNLIGKTKADDFTPNASVSAAYTSIDTMRVLVKPSNTGNMASGDLALDWFTNYEYATQYWNTDASRGCATQVINDGEATTCWTAHCVGDSVSAINTPTPKCGTNGITLIKAQTGNANSCYSVSFPVGECFRNMRNKYIGFWFYLDCTACSCLHTDAPLKVRVGCALPTTTYKEFCWNCQDLSCGWQLLMTDMKYPESSVDEANHDETVDNCMTFHLTTCVAASVLASAEVVIDHVVNSVYGLNFSGKNANAEIITNEEDANSLVNSVTVLGAGDGNNQLTTTNLGAACTRSCLAKGESFLSQDHTAAATTITMFDTTGYPSCGAVCIDAECIDYCGKTATTLTGATRGTNSTTAICHVCNTSVMTVNCLELSSSTGFPASGNVCVGKENIAYTGCSGNFITGLTRGASSTDSYAHIKNIEVYDAQYTTASCEAGSSIAAYGLRSNTINCPNIIDQNLLDRTAQVIFANNCCPPKRITGNAMEPAFLERAWIGDTLLVNDESSSTQGNFRLVRAKPFYTTEEGIGYGFELSNKKIGMVEELQKKSDQINEQGQYMQGATNVYQLQSEDNVDTGKGTLIKFFLPDDTKAINCMKLSYSIGAYRTYSTATDGCAIVNAGCVPDSCGSGTNYEDTGSLDVDGNFGDYKLAYNSILDTLDGATFVRHLWRGGWRNFNDATQTDYRIFLCDCTTPEIICDSDVFTLNDGEGTAICFNDTTTRAGKCVVIHNVAAYQNDKITFAYLTEGTHSHGTHTHTSAAHCHAVVYGVTDTSPTICNNAGGNINIDVLIDGTSQRVAIETALGSCLTTEENAIDLLQFSSVLTPGNWHCVEVRSCDGLGRICSNLYNKVYIESST